MVGKIRNVRSSRFVFDNSHRWNEIGKIISEVQEIKHKHHTFAETLRDASVKPVTGIPILIFVLLSMFILIRVIGEGLINYLFEPFFENIWAPLMLKLSDILSVNHFIHDLLIGKLVNGSINYGESFGLLTTGLYVPLGAVLPYVFAFYTILSIMEGVVWPVGAIWD
ncbi:hypothetical protein ES705_50799 [subsurface metagenome]